MITLWLICSFLWIAAIWFIVLQQDVENLWELPVGTILGLISGVLGGPVSGFIVIFAISFMWLQDHGDKPLSHWFNRGKE